MSTSLSAPPRYCADVIALLGDKYVLIERLSEPVGLAFPGGGQDPGETLSDTACREFVEETNLEFSAASVLGNYADPGRDQRRWSVSVVFIGIARGIPRDEPDKTRVVLLTRAEVEQQKSRFVFDHKKIWDDYIAACVN